MNTEKTPQEHAKDVVYSFAWLMFELESKPDAASMRACLEDPVVKRKFQKVVDNGGKEALAWLGKHMVKMKE